MLRRTRFAVVASLLSVIGACSTPAAPQRVQCTRDPVAMAENRECVVDGTCPCGTHCELGRCAALCTADADCDDDEACDAYGRCRSAGETALVPVPVASAPSGVVVLHATSISVDPASGEGTLPLRVQDGDVPRVRFIGRRGAEIACEPGTWTDDCELSDVEEGADLEVAVRRGEAMADGEIPAVRVWTSASHDTVTLIRPDQRPGARPDDAPATPLPGVYSGSGFVAATGLGDATDPGSAPSGLAAIPFDAELWGADDGSGTMTLAVTDAYGALTSAGSITANVTLIPGTQPGRWNGTFDVAPVPYFEGTVGGETYAVVAETLSAEIEVRADPSMIELSIVQRLHGFGAPATTRWVLTLIRQDDPSGDAAPSVPAGVALPDDDALRATPSPWELALATAFPPFDSLTLAEQRQRLSWAVGEPPDIAACFQPFDGMPSALYLGAYGGLSPRVADWPSDPVFMARAWNGNWPTDVAPVEAHFGRPTFRGGWAPNELPCNGNGLSIGWSGGTRLTEIRFGDCSRIQEETGCTFSPWGPIYTGGFSVDVELVYADHTEVQTLNANWIANTVCILPERPRDCAAAVACAEASAGSSPASVVTGTFEESNGVISGDALCAGTGRSGAIAIDATGDTGTLPTQSIAFDGCRADVEALAEAPPALGSARYGDALQMIFEDGACVDAPRLAASTAVGLTTRGTEAESIASRSYAMRLIGRWLRLHAAIATEAAERHAMAGALADGETPDLIELLDESLAGWDLVLHPRNAGNLAALAPDELASPDYRPLPGEAAPTDEDEIRVGVPAVMLGALADQSQLLRLVLEEARLATEPDRVDRIAILLPRLVAARALAFGLEQRLVDAGTSFPWRSRYESAESRLATGLGSAIAEARALLEGRNPLGIEDDDLPLYFLDDAPGPGGRFAAVSDFILGTGPGSTAWAPTLVRDARSSLESARARYVAQQAREYVVERDRNAHEVFLVSMAFDYDERLRDFCGPLDTLVDDPNFDAATCYVDPDCRPTDDHAYDLWTTEDVRGLVCMHERVTSPFSATTGLLDPRVRSFLDSCPDAEETITLERCGDLSQHCLVCGAEELPLGLGNLAFAWPRPTGSADQSLQDMIAATRDPCLRAHPTFREFPPSSRDIFATPGCVRGSLGEGQLDVASAERAVQAARAAYAEQLEAYDIAVESCNILEGTEDEIARRRTAHEGRMRELSTVQMGLDMAATVAGGVKECAATVAGGIDSIAGGVVACVAGGVETGLTVASMGVQHDIEQAQRDFDAGVAELQAQSEIARCFNDARQYLVGMRSSAIAIEQAIFDMNRAMASVQTNIEDANRIYLEGRAYVAEITPFPLRPRPGDIWIDEEITTYTRRFRLARRATYLAVRAVEYEFQASLPARGDVLVAKSPDDLEAVLSSLWSSSATRSISGSRPSDLHVVLSLRDDVMRLQDFAGLPAGLRSLTPEQRFHELLSSRDYATYDDTGRYLGQRVPFTLAPLGAIGADPGAVAIYGTSDCAERLWAVNASMVGTDVFEGSDTSFVRIELQKQNTFYSQWCGTAPDDQPFQMASVRPTRNLFREPGTGESVGADEFGTELGLTQYSRARIEAFFDVSRAELENPMYANGETSELAARGLFGEYALFIPAELIARESLTGGYTSGLVLDRVDDILLRLDYVSVARP